MNNCPSKKRAQILSMLCDGSSMRSISRVADVSFNTVNKLLIDAGTVCAAYQDKTVQNVNSKRVQLAMKFGRSAMRRRRTPATATAAPQGPGDVWTWTAIDADTKLIIAWMIGPRDGWVAYDFMNDLSGRLANRGTAHHGRPPRLSGRG